jgi:glycosyltransferase involved in cell wall biosynthesis
MISIIIPAYNSSATIVEALESVAAQTGMDYEVIVVDDCSTDDTVAVVRRWIAAQTSATSHASRFTLHLLSLNAGPAAARNAGMAAAKGEWIAFLDADDLWLPRHLEVLMAAAHETGAALVCGEAVRFEAPAASGKGQGDPSPASGYPSSGQETRNQEPGTRNVFRAVTLEEFVRHNPVATSAVLAKREALLAVGGFDPQFRGPEDYDLWMRIAALGAATVIDHSSLAIGTAKNQEPRTKNLVFISTPVSLYRYVPGSLSMDERRFLPQVLRVIDKAFGSAGAMAGHPEWRGAALATQYWNASWMAFQRGDKRAAMRLWWKAWRLNRNATPSVQRAWFRLLVRYVAGKRGE